MVPSSLVKTLSWEAGTAGFSMAWGLLCAVVPFMQVYNSKAAVEEGTFLLLISYNNSYFKTMV